MRLPLLLGGGVFLLLLGGYTLLSPWLDLSAISGNLQAKEGFTAATFPLAALYITFGNSLLEELFFRGFAFLALYRSGYKKLAWTFSAIAFALYHVSHHGRLVPPGPAGPAYLWAGLRRASVQRSGRKKPDHMARLAGPHGGQPGHQHHRPSPVGDHLTKGECPAPSVCWPWYPIWLMKQQVGLCGSHRV